MLDETACEEPAQHALDHGTKRAVCPGEPRRIHAQELLEVLLDETKERGLQAPDAAGTPAHRSPRQPTCRRERPARIKNESPVCSGEKSLRPARAETGPDPGLGDFGGLADRAGDRVRPPPPLAATSRRDERPGCRLRPRGNLRHGQRRGATASRPVRGGSEAQVEPEARAWIDAHFPREEQERL